MSRDPKGIKANIPLHFEFGGLISWWAYIRNNIFVGKWMGFYREGGAYRGALKWDFTVFAYVFIYLFSSSSIFVLNI